MQPRYLKKRWFLSYYFQNEEENGVGSMSVYSKKGKIAGPEIKSFLDSFREEHGHTKVTPISFNQF